MEMNGAMHMDKGQEKYIYRKFIISVSLASVLCLSVIFSIVSCNKQETDI